MMEALYEVLMNAGPLGLFVAYLAYDKKELQKKTDSHHQEWMQKLNSMLEKQDKVRVEMQAKYEDREDKVRERWMQVVEKVEAERDEAQLETARRVDELCSSMANLATANERMALKLDEITTRLIAHNPNNP